MSWESCSQPTSISCKWLQILNTAYVLSHDGSMYAIYGNMDPINIPQMLAYIPYMDPMGIYIYKSLEFQWIPGFVWYGIPQNPMAIICSPLPFWDIGIIVARVIFRNLPFTAEPKKTRFEKTLHLGMSENRVYSQWNSHLIGIMISKTIGCRGLAYFHFQTNPPIFTSKEIISLWQVLGLPWRFWHSDNNPTITYTG